MTLMTCIFLACEASLGLKGKALAPPLDLVARTRADGARAQHDMCKVVWWLKQHFAERTIATWSAGATGEAEGATVVLFRTAAE